MKRLNIEINDALIEEAMTLANLKTKKDAVHAALKFRLMESKRMNPKAVADTRLK